MKADRDGTQSKARTAFNVWLRQQPSQEKAAKFLGVEQASVSVWSRGRARPDPTFRSVIEALLGIPSTDWETDEERARRLEALSRVREAS